MNRHPLSEIKLKFSAFCHIPINKCPREKQDWRPSVSIPYFSLLTSSVFFGDRPLAGLCLLNTETAGNYTMFSKFSSLASWLTQLKTGTYLEGKTSCVLRSRFCHSSTVQSQSSTSFSVPQQWPTAWAKPKFSASSLDFRENNCKYSRAYFWESHGFWSNRIPFQL